MAKRKYSQELYENRIRPLLEAIPGSNAEKEKKMGLPSKIISNWNNAGYGSWADYLHELSVFLNVSVEYLTGESDDPTPIQAQSIPHEKLREVFAEGGVHVLLDADNKMPANHLMDIIDYIKVKQQENDRK